MLQPHILIVEDNADLARAMSILLQGSGYNATYALTGAASLRSLDAQAPDLVFLDLNIGSVNGLDLLQEMRRRGLPGEARVVIFTALDDPELRDRARRLGACDYVVKGTLDGEYLENLAHYHLARASTTAVG
jgi:DNA-binding response OmpR family regulator